jgi:hypothetical protein
MVIFPRPLSLVIEVSWTRFRRIHLTPIHAVVYLLKAVAAPQRDGDAAEES